MKDARQPSLGFWLISLLAWLPLVGLVSAQGEEPEPVPVIDVLVVWTPGVPQQSGSPQLSLAEDLINQANTIFLNSHAKVRLRLAHATKVAFQPEVRPWLPDVLPFTLDRLLDPADGHLDEVHALRDQHNADLVVLLVEWAPGMEGFAAPGNATAEQAFGVLSLGAGFEFTRLVGRLLGCGAQLGTVDELGFVPQAGTFADSHATVGTNATYGIFASVMGIGPSPLPLFSNPDLSCYGRPMGLTGRANNVRTLNARAAEVAAFRPPASFLQPPVVTWRTPSAGAVFRSGTTVPLSLTVANGETTVKRIELFSTDPQTGLVIPGQPALLNLAGPPFELRLTNAAAGWHRWQARAVDSNGIAGQAEIEFRVRADNDEFANRRPLPTPGGRVPASLDGMALEPGEPSYPPDTVEATGWFTWTAPADGLLRAEFQWTAPAWPARAVTLHAFRGDTLATLTALTNTAQTGRPLILPVRAGETVQLAAGCLRDRVESARFTELWVDFFPQQTNNTFESRALLAGSTVQVSGHNLGAGATPFPTVWWSWNPPRDGLARVFLGEQAPGHGILVQKGASLETMTSLESIAPGLLRSRAFPVRDGEPIHLAVSSPEQSAGRFEFQVELLPDNPHGQFSDRRQISGLEGSWPVGIPVAVEPNAPESVKGYACWWEWTAPKTGRVRLHAGYNGSLIQVFRGNALADLQPVGFQAFGGVVFEAVAGMTYQVAVNWPELPEFVHHSGPTSPLRLGYFEPNDDFSNRKILTGVNPTWTIPNVLGLLKQDDSSFLRGPLWFSWKAASTGLMSLTILNSEPELYASIELFSGTALSNLTQVPRRELGNSPYGYAVEAGVEYHLAISGDLSRGSFGPATFQLLRPAPPANDSFADRPRLNGIRHTLSGETSIATAAAGEPVIPGLGPADSGTVWWNWIAPRDGLMTLNVERGALGIYQRTPEGGWQARAQTVGISFAALRVKAGESFELMLAGAQDAIVHLAMEQLIANDDFAGRSVIKVKPGLGAVSVQGSTVGATRESWESLTSPDVMGRSRWWTWSTPLPATARIAVSGGSLFKRVHAEQYRLRESGTLERIAWSNGGGSEEILRFHADPGIEYPLVIDGSGTEDIYYSFAVELIPDRPPPANNALASAELIEGRVVRVDANHRVATAEPGEPNHGGRPAARTLWWRWTAPATAQVRIRAQTTGLDYPALPELYPPQLPTTPSRPQVSVYVGESLGSLASVGSSQPLLGQFESAVTFSAQAGTTYLLAFSPLDPTKADAGDFAFELVQSATNDRVADRVLLTGARVRLTGSAAGATRDADEWVAQPPSTAPNPALMNVWWEWTALADLRVTLRNRNPNHHFWAAWRSDHSLRYAPLFSSLDRFFGWEDTRRDFLVQAGERWLLAVYAHPTNTVPVDIELEGVPIPANDDFASRAKISGERVHAVARADNSSRESNEPPHGIGTVGLPGGRQTNAPSLWWTWTAPLSGAFSASTTIPLQSLPGPSGIGDTVARADCTVYVGNGLTELVKVAGTGPETTSPPTGLKQVKFNATAGTTYQFAVCPQLEERRIWDDARYFTGLMIDPAPPNLTADAALELAGTTAWVTGNLRSVPTGLWWRWTAPAGGQVSLLHQLGGAPPNLRVSVTAFRRDDATGSLVPVETPYWTMAWDRMVNYFAAEAGQTYWLNVKVTSQQGWLTDLHSQDLPFDLSLSLVRRSQDNDAFSQRERLSGPTVVLTGDNTGATREPDEPLHTGLLGRGSLWWEWTAPRAGRWTLANLARWSPPLLVELYRGGSLTTLTSAAAWRNPLKNEVVFDAGAGETFVVAVDNPGRWEGPFQLNLVPSTPPPNDLFAKRAVLRGAAPDWTGTNTGALREEGEPAHAGSPALASVWWSWTAAVSAPTVLTVTPGDDTTLWGTPAVAIYRGDALSSLVPVADNRLGGERSKALVFRAEAGDTYHLALSTPPDETGIYRLTLSPTNAPANDHFDRRIALNGSRIQTTVSSAGATLESEEPNLLSPLAGSSLWWTWTAPASGRTTIDTSLSTFDTRLAVFHGDSLASLSLMALNDDQTVMAGSQALASSRVALEAVAGTSYQIQLGGVGGAYGWATLTILGPDVPPPELAGAGTPEQSSIRRLRLVGSPGQTVWIQSSEDLLNWQWVGSVRFVETEAEWEDPGLSFEVARFYRLVLPP